MFVLPHRVVLSLLLLLLGCVATLLAAGPSPARAVGVDDLFVKAPDSQPQRGAVVVRLSAGAAEVISVRARGHVRLGARKFGLRPAQATIAAGRRAALELRPRKRWQQRKILAALRKGRTLPATIKIRFRNIAGMTATRKLRIRLT